MVEQSEAHLTWQAAMNYQQTDMAALMKMQRQCQLMTSMSRHHLLPADMLLAAVVCRGQRETNSVLTSSVLLAEYVNNSH